MMQAALPALVVLGKGRADPGLRRRGRPAEARPFPRGTGFRDRARREPIQRQSPAVTVASYRSPSPLARSVDARAATAPVR